MKSDSANASSAKPTANRSYPRPQPITLSMIGMELERDWTKLQSRFVKAIIKVFGIKAK